MTTARITYAIRSNLLGRHLEHGPIDPSLCRDAALVLWEAHDELRDDARLGGSDCRADAVRRVVEFAAQTCETIANDGDIVADDVAFCGHAFGWIERIEKELHANLEADTERKGGFDFGSNALHALTQWRQMNPVRIWLAVRAAILTASEAVPVAG